jgi:hypothetical protein
MCTKKVAPTLALKGKKRRKKEDVCHEYPCLVLSGEEATVARKACQWLALQCTGTDNNSKLWLLCFAWLMPSTTLLHIISSMAAAHENGNYYRRVLL